MYQFACVAQRLELPDAAVIRADEWKVSAKISLSVMVKISCSVHALLYALTCIVLRDCMLASVYLLGGNLNVMLNQKHLGSQEA
jgi:hypothetical protein